MHQFVQQHQALWKVHVIWKKMMGGDTEMLVVVMMLINGGFVHVYRVLLFSDGVSM